MPKKTVASKRKASPAPIFLGTDEEVKYTKLLKADKAPRVCKYFVNQAHFHELHLDEIKGYLDFQGLNKLFGINENTHLDETRQFYANFRKLEDGNDGEFKTRVNGKTIILRWEELDRLLEVPLVENRALEYSSPHWPSTEIGFDVHELARKYFKYDEAKLNAREHKISLLEPQLRIAFEIIISNLLPGGHPAEPSTPKIVSFYMLAEMMLFSPGFAILKHMHAISSRTDMHPPYGNLITLICKKNRIKMSSDPIKAMPFDETDIAFKGLAYNVKKMTWVYEEKKGKGKRKFGEDGEEDTSLGENETLVLENHEKSDGSEKKCKGKISKKLLKKLISMVGSLMDEQREIREEQKVMKGELEVMREHQEIMETCMSDILEKFDLPTFPQRRADHIIRCKAEIIFKMRNDFEAGTSGEKEIEKSGEEEGSEKENEDIERIPTPWTRMKEKALKMKRKREGSMNETP